MKATMVSESGKKDRLRKLCLRQTVIIIIVFTNLARDSV